MPTVVKNSNADTLGAAIQIDSFPLVVGHKWIYSNGDTIRAVADTVIDGIRATKLVKTNDTFSAVIYLSNSSIGILEIATNWQYSYDGLTGPLFNGYSASDSLQVPTPSFVIAKLPVDTGAFWDTHDPRYTNANIRQRQWTGFAKVTTSAGTFNCVKINSSYYTEYYSEKGLVKVVENTECLIAPCPVFYTYLVYVNF